MANAMVGTAEGRGGDSPILRRHETPQRRGCPRPAASPAHGVSMRGLLPFEQQQQQKKKKFGIKTKIEKGILQPKPSRAPALPRGTGTSAKPPPSVGLPGTAEGSLLPTLPALPWGLGGTPGAGEGG